jgi:hypothetical protein
MSCIGSSVHVQAAHGAWAAEESLCCWVGRCIAIAIFIFIVQITGFEWNSLKDEVRETALRLVEG